LVCQLTDYLLAWLISYLSVG